MNCIRFGATIYFTNATLTDEFQWYMKKNGASVIGSAGIYETVDGTTYGIKSFASGPVEVSEGDLIGVQLLFSSDTSVDINNLFTCMWIEEWIG